MTTVIVTGASGGLGTVLVKELEASGKQVVTVERSRLLSKGAWWDLLHAHQPDGAVLVAGSWQGGKRLYQDEDDAIWHAMLESNLETARVALQALLPGMVERRRGSIVAVGSRAAPRPWESTNAAATVSHQRVKTDGS